MPIRAKQEDDSLQYRKLGDSDLNISEITLGTGKKKKKSNN